MIINKKATKAGMKKEEMILKEFCAENFEHIPKAIEAGANRIELCDNLSVGGTTVSYGVMKETISFCKQKNIPVMAMIRPRGGDFVYNENEISIMLADVAMTKSLGIDGVVFGALTKDNSIDETTMKRLIAESHGLQITFHMTFDNLSEKAQFNAIDWLVENGIHRILSHGGPIAHSPIEDNFNHLKALIKYANNRIIILPGGKINFQNCEMVTEFLGVSEVHGTKIVNFV